MITATPIETTFTKERLIELQREWKSRPNYIDALEVGSLIAGNIDAFAKTTAQRAAVVWKEKAIGTIDLRNVTDDGHFIQAGQLPFHNPYSCDEVPTPPVPGPLGRPTYLDLRTGVEGAYCECEAVRPQRSDVLKGCHLFTGYSAQHVDLLYKAEEDVGAVLARGFETMKQHTHVALVMMTSTLSNTIHPSGWAEIAGEVEKFYGLGYEDIGGSGLAETAERHATEVKANEVEIIGGPESPIMPAIRDFLAKNDRAVVWVSEPLCDSRDLDRIIAAELRANPELRIVVVRDLAACAKHHIGALKILLRDGLARSNDTTVTVRRSTNQDDWQMKDPSVRVVTPYTDLANTQIDRLYVMALTPRNQKTAERRARTRQWIDAELLKRMSPTGRVAFIGEPTHMKAVDHELSKLPGWKHCLYPLEAYGIGSMWPEKWPTERIAEWRAKLGPVEAARQIDLCLTDSGE